MSLDLCIGFSRTNSFVSRVMQWFMRSVVSHTFIAVTLEGKMRVAIGVDGKGLHWQSMDKFKEHSEIVAVFTPLQPIEESFWWAFDEYGRTDYDYVAAGAIGFRNRIKWIWRLFGKLWRKSLDEKKLTCMEYVTRMLQHAQYPSMLPVDPELFDTHQVMVKLFETPDEFRVEWVSNRIKQEPYVPS